MDIRKLELSDQEAYRRYEAAMLSDKQGNPFVELEFVEDLEQAILDGQQSEVKQAGQTWSPYSTYYGFIDNEIVGMVRCFWEADNSTVLDLGEVGYMVHPHYRWQGIAQALLAFALDLFEKKGYEKVSVATDRDNLPSRGLIKKMGGQLESIRQIHYFGQSMLAAKYWIYLGKENT
ncbi:GNAT family N-acetyltransferase [Streptococcus gallinaceus]|uniref:Acetyltransferase n=1 Tax=Streptococcus gallinaceus TaxID=165758 RepID=A0ABV2JIC0_9STRE